jgi:YVTN family beta-propeller protein
MPRMTGQAWASPANAGTVTVIDPSSLKITATVTVGDSPYGVAVGPRWAAMRAPGPVWHCPGAEDFIRRYAGLDRELDQIWECW